MATPNIRFKGFTDDWEQRKLEAVVDSVDTGKSKFDKEGSSGEYPILGSTSVIGYDNEYDYEGDFILTARVGANAGSLYRHAGKVKISDNTVFIQASKNIEFLYHLLTQFDIKKLSFGTGQPLVKASELKNLELMMPTDINEQMKIGDYFKQLDNLITLHQRKCDDTKKIKKYMLSKMFPKNGAKIPEIRFEGFTDDWEQRKFSDFTWNAGKRNSQNLDLEPYAVTNDRGFIRQNEAHDEFGYMKDVDRKAYNIVKPNSFAYNPARINVGSIGYYEGTENVIVSSLYEVFQTADYVDDRFLWHWFKSDIFPKWIERLQEGSVRLYFYYDKLCECKILMPSLPEQKKIAATLDKIDNLITLHQRKCDELKELKKYMLQNMFPQKG